MSLKTAGRLAAEIENLQSLMEGARKAAFEAGYRIGYVAGRSDEHNNEQVFGFGPGDAFDMWIKETEKHER